MAAESAARWAVGALGVVCLILKLDFMNCHIQEIYGAVNGNVTFYVSKFQPFTEIIWKKENDKVIEWDGPFEPEAFQSFKGRVYLDTVSGNLTITRLTKADEGLYGIESPSVKNDSTFFLTVIEPLPSPSTSCFSVDDENITLVCEIMGHSDVNSDDNLIQYLWECPSAIQCHSSSRSSEVYVSSKSDLSQTVQCVVSNPLFTASASLSLSTCVPQDTTRHRYVLFAILPAVICGLLFLKCFLGRRSQRNPGP